MPKPLMVIDGDELRINQGIDELFEFEEDNTTIDFDDDVFSRTTQEDDENDQQIESSTDDSDDSDVDIQADEEEVDTNQNTQDDLDDSDEPGDYNDYSDTAMYALGLKQTSDVFFDIDVKKDMKPKEFLSLIETSYKSKIEAVENDLKEQYKAVETYVELLKNNREDLVVESIRNGQYSNVEINESTPESVLENVVKFTYSRKGIPESDTYDLISSYKDKGILDEKAKECVQYNQEYDKQLTQRALEESKVQQERFLEEQKSYKNKFIETVNTSKTLDGVIKDKDAVIKALFEPTEVVDIQEGNKKKTIKVPKYNVLMEEFSNNVEKQLLFVQLLLDNFSFSTVKQNARNQVNTEIMDALEDRTTKRKPKTPRNPWFDN